MKKQDPPMTRMFAPDPRIKKLAEVCDQIKVSREKDGRDTWSAAERRAFFAAAKLCGASFPSFTMPNGAAVDIAPQHDAAEARIRDRERQERAERLKRTTAPAPGVRPSLVYASDDDDTVLEFR